MFRALLVIFLVVIIGVVLVLATTVLKTGTTAGANHFLKLCLRRRNTPAMISADYNLYSKFKFIEVTNSGLLQSIGDYYFDILIDGQTHGGAQFYLAPSEQSMDIEHTIGGSSFALLRHLLQKLNVDLTPEKLNLFLESHPDFLSSNLPSTEDCDYTLSAKHQLILSFGNGSNFCLFPTNDFAFTVFDSQLHGCMVSDMDNERVFFTIEFRNNALDRQVVSCLKSFMSNPLKSFQNQQVAPEAKPETVPSPTVRKSSSLDGATGKGRRCLNCFCPSTPMWRRGPTGSGTLCNACGVKWMQGRLVMDEATIEAHSLKIKMEIESMNDSDSQSQAF